MDIGLTGGRDWLTVPGPALRLGGVSFSPDGRSFAVPGQVTGVTIRDVETGARIVALKGHDATISRMVFSQDGSRLAGASGNGKRQWVRTLPIWDVTTGDLVTSLTGHSGFVTAVAVSPDGRRLATSSADETLRVWDVFCTEWDAVASQSGVGPGLQSRRSIPWFPATTIATTPSAYGTPRPSSG